MALNQSQFSQVIVDAGLSGRAICIHSSFRSLGKVDGGPAAVVEAFLNCGCTVLVPTFTYDVMVDPETGPYPDRNGCDYTQRYYVDDRIDRAFDPQSTTLSIMQMGAIPAAVLSHPDHVRGCHPICSFSAVGPLANQLINGQTPCDVFAPLRAVADNSGVVLLLGVGLTKLTIGHAAEELSGRRPFIRWARMVEVGIIPSLTGGCATGFDKLGPCCSDLRSDLDVGDSHWIHFPAGPLLERLTAAIKADPHLTHCESEYCERCRDAVLGGPIGMDELTNHFD